MIFAVHALIYAHDAEKARAFLRDVFGWPHVDAGHGWLIFSMPPAEVGIHPAMPNDPQDHHIYLMVKDVKKVVARLEKLGHQCGPIRDAGFGLTTSFELPGGGPIGMYQPRHPVAAGMAAAPGNKSPERKRQGTAAKPRQPAHKKRSARKSVRKPAKNPARKKRR